MKTSYSKELRKDPEYKSILKEAGDICNSHLRRKTSYFEEFSESIASYVIDEFKRRQLAKFKKIKDSKLRSRKEKHLNKFCTVFCTDLKKLIK